eukprot:7198120-Prymnesium_polylepis.2
MAQLSPWPSAICPECIISCTIVAAITISVVSKLPSTVAVILLGSALGETEVWLVRPPRIAWVKSAHHLTANAHRGLKPSPLARPMTAMLVCSPSALTGGTAALTVACTVAVINQLQPPKLRVRDRHHEKDCPASVVESCASFVIDQTASPPASMRIVVDGRCHRVHVWDVVHADFTWISFLGFGASARNEWWRRGDRKLRLNVACH